MHFIDSQLNVDIERAIECANLDKLDDAVNLVEQFYRKNPLAKDAFAIIGNVFCLSTLTR